MSIQKGLVAPPAARQAKLSRRNFLRVAGLAAGGGHC